MIRNHPSHRLRIKQPVAVLGLCGLALFLHGCSAAPNPMPLDLGREWTYAVSAGFQKFVEPVRVVGRVPVSKTEGYKLEGPLGTSHLAYEDGKLIASKFANSSFEPPLPLLDTRLKNESKPKSWAWTGSLRSFGYDRPASATISQSKTKVDFAGESIDAIRTDILIRSKSAQIELRTWFRPGYGIVQQEQRTNRNLIVALQLISSKTVTPSMTKSGPR